MMSEVPLYRHRMATVRIPNQFLPFFVVGVGRWSIRALTNFR